MHSSFLLYFDVWITFPLVSHQDEPLGSSHQPVKLKKPHRRNGKHPPDNPDKHSIILIIRLLAELRQTMCDGSYRVTTRTLQRHQTLLLSLAWALFTCAQFSMFSNEFLYFKLLDWSSLLFNPQCMSITLYMLYSCITNKRITNESPSTSLLTIKICRNASLAPLQLIKGPVSLCQPNIIKINCRNKSER